MSTLPIWADFCQFKKYSLYDQLMTTFRVAGQQHPICFVDYSQTVPIPKRNLCYVDIKGFWEQPSVPYSNKTFTETIDSIAKGIISTISNSNRKLAVWYSGGTDSVSVLTSILRNADKQFLNEKVLVRLTTDSIDEYPLFFDRYIKDTLNYEYSSLIDYFNEDYLNIDGVFGDTVFGEHYIPELIESKYLTNDIDWVSEPVEVFEDILNSVLKNKKQSSWLFKSMESLFTKYNATTVFDAFWLQGAAMNLNQLHWMPFTLDSNISSISQEKFEKRFRDQYNMRMFSHPDMFLYAFNHRRSSASDIYRARLSSNLYALDFSGDRDYFDNKKKVSSQIKMYGSTPYSKITSNFSVEAKIIYRV